MPLLTAVRSWASAIKEGHVVMAAEEPKSERKQVSIPREDTSVLQWWDAQRDPGMSLRLIIRAEIERSGYVDHANRPVDKRQP
jgi:hypothetical protein